MEAGCAERNGGGALRDFNAREMNKTNKHQCLTVASHKRSDYRRRT